MKIHRFIGEFNLSKPEIASRDLDLIHQIKNVLRLKTGEPVELIARDGKTARANLALVSNDLVEFTVKEILDQPTNKSPGITLYCAIAKKDNFELICQKATEIGIATIAPIITERTIKTGLRVERLEKIIKEAAEQAGRTSLPELLPPLPYVVALEQLETKQTWLFDQTGEPLDSKTTPPPQAMLVGPEGGWTENELKLARDRGVKIVSLGPLTLRVETAAIIGSYLACHAHD